MFGHFIQVLGFSESNSQMIVSLVTVFICAVIIRLIYLLVQLNWGNTSSPNHHSTTKKARRTLIVLGSGGHTAEMLEIVKALNIERYAPRFYVISKTDTQSILKLVDVEVEKEPNSERHNFEIISIPRSREVLQSYWTSIVTTLWSTFSCIPILLRTRPDLILTNGPGTCVPVCLVAFWLKLFYINAGCRIVYVESMCRVKTLSLSGKMLLGISDLFVAQWPDVQACSSKIQYLGRLT